MERKVFTAYLYLIHYWYLFWKCLLRNKTHVEWARTWVQLLVDLQAYVKQHHTTGLVWAKAGTKPSGGPPPPPPPCGLPPMDDLCLAPADPDATNRSALFAEINRGADITKGKYYCY